MNSAQDVVFNKLKVLKPQLILFGTAHNFRTVNESSDIRVNRELAELFLKLKQRSHQTMGERFVISDHVARRRAKLSKGGSPFAYASPAARS